MTKNIISSEIFEMYLHLNTWIRDIRKELLRDVMTWDRIQIFGLLDLNKGFFSFNTNGLNPGGPDCRLK